MGMIRHDLASALARFRRAPFTTAANVMTLALGLACFIAAWGTATYWRSGDAHHPDADRIFYISQTTGGRPVGDAGMVNSLRLRDELKTEIPELEAVARLGGQPFGSLLLGPYSAGDASVLLQNATADAEIFDVFALDFVEGGPDTALARPNDIVLTQDAAQRLFGEAPALGQTVSRGGATEFTVSGVIAPIRQPSFMGASRQSPVSFDVIVSTEYGGRETPASWRQLGGTTFAKLPPGMSREVFQARLDDLADRKAEKDAQGRPRYGFTAVPVGEIASRLVDARILWGEGGLSAGAILLALAVLILVVACVNFGSLATAQVAGRLKESGMRRALGAGRGNLLVQQVLEAGLLSIPALGLALALVALAGPVFRAVLGVDPAYFLRDGGRGVLVLGATTVLSALAVAVWPSLGQIRVRAADALGRRPRGTASGFLSSALVGVQFASASFLLIVVAVTQLQHAHLRGLALDREGGAVVMMDFFPGLIQSPADQRRPGFDAFRTRLQALPQVRSVSAVGELPWIDNGGEFQTIYGSGEASAPVATVQETRVAEGYFETFGLRIVAGRALDPARGDGSGDLVPVVIDRSLADTLGWSDPQQAVGRTLYYAGQDADDRLARRPALFVVGVSETRHQRLAPGIAGFGAIGGATFRLDPELERAIRPVVRIDGQDVPGAIAAIRGVWDELSPDWPFRAHFLDAMFEEAYAPHGKVAAVFMALSGCALLISTAGLIGIAVHVAARRRHEIGVRKTLGATTPGVLRLLIADFSRPVVAGNLLAWPFAWMAAGIYLQNFAERAPLTPAPFILSLVFTLLVAWLAVGGRAWTAARVKPANVLRYE